MLFFTMNVSYLVKMRYNKYMENLFQIFRKEGTIYVFNG